VPIDTLRDARIERARARGWAQRLVALAAASADRRSSAEAVRRAHAETNRAAHDLEGRVRALQRGRA
jgi:hypothetical protein